MPATNDSICPWKSLKALIEQYPAPAHAPLFSRQSQYGYINGQYFTRNWFIEELRKLLTHAGINPMSYNGHSFRRGAAHSAAAAGMSNDDIKTLGRWKSDAYKLYTGQDNARRLNLASKLTCTMHLKSRSPSEIQIHSQPPTQSVSIAATTRSQ